MKKGGFLRNVLDTIRSNQAGQSGRVGSSGGASDRSQEYGNQLKPSHFSLCRVARHGFPENPTALAFDPVQKIAAIGTRSGAIRIFGRPGVDVWAQHEPAFAVTHIKFIVNQGAIITVTSDESIHLWSLRGPNLKLQLSASNQGASSCSPQTGGTSPAPTTASNFSLVSLQSGTTPTTATAAAISGASTGTSPSSILGQISDTVSGAVDSANDFLSGATSIDHQPSPSPTGEPSVASSSKHNVSRQPEILHTLKFQREHITCLHQTLSSKWLYIGTERGNVHVANVETFELSSYSIAWNKAIELSRKTHPGAIIHLSECPQDTNKLLIGYESGCIVLWDLKQKNADGRYYHTENLLWLAWHYEGKQFVAAHGDGSLITWQTRSNARPAQILHPHAKTAPSASASSEQGHHDLSQQQSISLASSFARSLNNELYRPINKVEWKTLKNNEQFLLFSGGLPFDGYDQSAQDKMPIPSGVATNQNKPPSRQSGTALSPARFAPTVAQQSQPQAQQFLKASSVSPSGMASVSPISPSASPNPQQTDSAGGSKSAASQQQMPLRQLQTHKKSLRSTSLTVMCGKSITVLEMDDTIIDFITVCDNAPYENDASDPSAVIVLLSNELILIDLTSSGYPSFDSPYPSASLYESPVTCIQYLADCSSDLIPFLYSTSQNVVSRAPKKGFSDKEWPINGGEWGQSMQSYPELVLTGHADGTIKFWDMSGINFDLISKIKTSKLFDRPNKPPNAIFVSSGSKSAGAKRPGAQNPPLRPGSPMKANTTSDPNHQHSSSSPTNCVEMKNQTVLEDGLFAIEKIEFCPNTKRLLVAGAFSQVIQFKFNKRDLQANSGSEGLTTILVEPAVQALPNSGNNSTTEQQQFQTFANQGAISGAPKQHLLFRVRDEKGATGSSSSGSSSSTGSYRSRLSGFQAELVCLTPLLVSTIPPDDYTIATTQLPPPPSSSSQMASTSSVTGSGVSPTKIAYYCQIPPKITALALQETHSILAYAHENGIVLVDVIQKCIIMNATLCDLYGGASITSNNRDITIQPFATSSILQHHYQATTSSASSPSAGGMTGFSSDFANANHNKLTADNSTAGHHHQQTKVRSPSAKGAAGEQVGGDLVSHNEVSTSAMTSTDQTDSTLPGFNLKGVASNGGQLASAAPTSSSSSSSKPPFQSRYATNSMFQRQLSTNALHSSNGSIANGGGGANSASSDSSSSSNNNNSCAQSGRGSTDGPGRLFQRQMTASQLLSGTSGASGVGGDPSSKQRAAALLASVRGDPSLTSSTACLPTAAAAAQQPALARLQEAPAKGKPTRNKRIISRMLSISAIHTTVSGGSGGSSGSNSNPGELQAMGSDDVQLATSEPLGAGLANDPAVADKFDSSFTRSRSSSSSSTTQAHALAQTASEPPAESIGCLAFLDPAASGGQPPLAPGRPEQVQSSSGPNHKSLSSIDAQAGGQLALWLGTSTGAVLLVALQMPDNEDNRVLQLQSITAEPIPQASVKLPGAILSLSVFACEPRAPVAPPTGSQSSSLEAPEGVQSTGGLHSPGGSSSAGAGTATTAGGRAQLDSSAHSSFESSRPALFLAIASEKQARVYQVPTAGHHQQPPSAGGSTDHLASSSKFEQQQLDSTPLSKLLVNKQNLFAQCELADSSFAACSQVIQMRQPPEEPSCLISYLASGNLLVHPLPRLRPQLMDADLVALTSPRIASTMRLSRNGHCLYQPSAGEICKFSISGQYKALVNDMTGSLYVPREMPEMPRANFFKALFSVSQASKQSDRDELFGEAGRGPRGVAKHTGGASSTGGGLDKLKSAATGTMGHDMRLAREGLDERGEKLNELEDRTLAMLNQSESYAQAAHQLAQKFKDKKWYQF